MDQSEQIGAKYSDMRRKPRPAVIVLIVLLHILALYGLARAFAPDFTQTVEREVLSTFNVTITAPPDDPPTPDQVPDEGAQGEAGKKAVARAETAPEVERPLKKTRPAPKASSTGSANSSGARDDGNGTGAAGSGDGTGSGRGGSGAGGGAVATKAVKISGDISNASDYPIPEGGREARIGTSVSIAITVGPDGLPKACRVFRPGPFPDTNLRTCELAMARFRFRPAMDQNGTPVTSVYGWKQDFFN